MTAAEAERSPSFCSRNRNLHRLSSTVQSSNVDMSCPGNSGKVEKERSPAQAVQDNAVLARRAPPHG
jgi:hypothetical protein